ncbi:MAG: transporter substrate-binding domain-containing protein [Francisellaceae bacterium]|jgi:polar amino acid transport system substrate-binding protein|nr:transporter substrate-binding domain-containing protein [Francisellaceae bacterium]MBT6538693.1 transporter substrate-binding domain-containing protein [Francisellaceae bacterium]
MKIKRLFLSTIFAMLLAPLAFATTVVTMVGDANYKPFIYDEQGVAKGKYVDIVSQAFELMPDYELRWQMMPWQEGLDAVKNGNAFAIVPPYYRPNERPWISPYSEPLYTEDFVVVCNNTAMSQPRNYFPNDYLGLTFTGDTGNTAGNPFSVLVKEGKIKLIESDSSMNNLEMVSSGQADCYTNNSILVDNLMIDMPSLSKGLVIKKVSSENAHVGFAKNSSKFPYKNDFIQKFNAALKQVKEHASK